MAHAYREIISGDVPPRTSRGTYQPRRAGPSAARYSLRQALWTQRWADGQLGTLMYLPLYSCGRAVLVARRWVAYNAVSGSAADVWAVRRGRSGPAPHPGAPTNRWGPVCRERRRHACQQGPRRHDTG